MKDTYSIDAAHSSVHFSVRHLMISNVRGAFSKVTGTVVFDPENPTETTIEAVIDASSVNTNDAQRDGHLKSADFLDVEHSPTITFKSTKIEPVSEGEWKVTGDLTIHGVTKTEVLKVEGPTPEGKDPWGNTRIGASATTKIKRSDFGLTWNAALETGGVVISDDVKLEMDLELIKAQVSTA
jgi:polyisoprenoid-binding protein YceI